MEGLRPRPSLANSRTIALEFVKRYFAQVGRSPSHGEISNGTRLTRRQVQVALHALAGEGAILLRPGPLGISLPRPADQLSEGDVLLLLQERGILLNLQAAAIGEHCATVANPCLPLAAAAAHTPREGGGSDDASGGTGA